MSNKLVSKKLYVIPNGQAAQQADLWAASRPDKARLMRILAEQPVAKWLEDDATKAATNIDSILRAAVTNDETAVFVMYNIPSRDIQGKYSSGGLSESQYKHWIDKICAAIGSASPIIIVEPDALCDLDRMSESDKKTRIDLLRYATSQLKQYTQSIVYIDAGHARWIPADKMSKRIEAIGLDNIDGFSLNVSNYVTTAENELYAEQISRNLEGMTCVIDTSRNGRGPSLENDWCNPPDRAIGTFPTTITEKPLVEAYLWIKLPGGSDGECNGGPPAGKWWPEKAVELVCNRIS